VTDPQVSAFLARFREDLRRSRQALEAIAATGEHLRELIEQPEPSPAPGILRIDYQAHDRPAEALARSMIAYLDKGGRLEPDVALELSQALANSRGRRRSDAALPT
jgi:hypothetical protein